MWYANQPFILSTQAQLMIKANVRIGKVYIKLIIVAYMMFVGTTFLSILAYKGIPLSMGPILEATSYIYVTFFGVKIFKEKLNRKKIVALCLIICGIIIYAIG